MKRVIAIGLVANAVLLAGILLKKEVVVHAEGGVSAGNGDVNGDGRLDIADAIYIIQFQFTGGPLPVRYEDPELLQRIDQMAADLSTKSAALDTCSSALSTFQAELAAESASLEACSAELSKSNADLVMCQANLGRYGLPATGQTKCYDLNGEVINCASTVYPGQDGRYKAGCPAEGRFKDNGDGTVSDTCTGLMWQKDNAPSSYTWQDALKYCEALRLGGHLDWRLPNLRELQSIVDYGRTNPAIDPLFGAVPAWYWSSTTFPDPPNTVAWGIGFTSGFLDGYNVGVGQYSFVRAVRSGP
jgi:uncharacterized protein DUF1566